MTLKNRYAKFSKIWEYKYRQITKLFAYDLTAAQIAKITGLNRNTINKYLTAIRQWIAEFCEFESFFRNEVEVYESYFGAMQLKGKRGRGAYGKNIVVGIFRRNGKVYTEIVPYCSKATLQGVIRGRVNLDTIIQSDKWRCYNGLADVGYKKHFRVDHGRNEFVYGKFYINGIEVFRGFAKTKLGRFKGMHKKRFIYI